MTSMLPTQQSLHYVSDLLPQGVTSEVATRRSPRSIENLCNELQIPFLDSKQTATLLSLAHCTGWSADQIANKLKESTGVALSPELVWNNHWIWVSRRDEGDQLSAAVWDIMQVLMRGIGVELKKPGRPLSKTSPPTSIRFVEQWNAKNDGARPIFPGYTAETREASKEYLFRRKGNNIYGSLTPIEEYILGSFGEHMLCIFKDTLEKWAHAMLAKVQEDPGLRPIRDRVHVNLIMEYLKRFQDSYEEKFGTMESGKPSSAFGEIRDNTVFIKSTGYGVKVVLGFVMADRMHVVERKRKVAREITGCVEVAPENLEDDGKNCPICQEPMGVEASDGTKETPLRLVICCGQVIGARCLRTWLSVHVYEDVYRDTCPVCRFKFSDSFLKKIFSEDEIQARIAKVNGILEPASPSPDLVEVIRSQQEQDAQQRREGDRHETLEEGEVIDISDFSPLMPMLNSQVLGRMALELSGQSGVSTGWPAGMLPMAPDEFEYDERMGDDFHMEG